MNMERVFFFSLLLENWDIQVKWTTLSNYKSKVSSLRSRETLTIRNSFYTYADMQINTTIALAHWMWADHRFDRRDEMREERRNRWHKILFTKNVFFIIEHHLQLINSAIVHNTIVLRFRNLLLSISTKHRFTIQHMRTCPSPNLR